MPIKVCLKILTVKEKNDTTGFEISMSKNKEVRNCALYKNLEIR